MTLVMFDSIYPSTLPPGADAYLGYVDGHWPTCAAVRAMFPHVPVICLTVTGATLNADGCDIETGDLSATTGAQWLKAKLATKPVLPPVAYCSVNLMTSVVAELAAIGVNRSQVRLLSAHYNYVPHICGPDSCNKIDLPQDGTQWTDVAQGVGGVGVQIDQSQLNPAFFTTTPEGNTDMATLVYGQNGRVYLLDGGRAHVVQTETDVTTMQGSPNVGAIGGPTQGGRLLTTGEEAQFLLDFPAGNPAVTVTVPPVTVDIPNPLPVTLPTLTVTSS